MKDRTSADPIDRNAVDKVRLPVQLSGAYGAGEKTEGIWLNAREAQPADLSSDRARLLHWQKCYGALWQLKVSFEKQHNR